MTKIKLVEIEETYDDFHGTSQRSGKPYTICKWKATVDVDGERVEGAKVSGFPDSKEAFLAKEEVEVNIKESERFGTEYSLVASRSGGVGGRAAKTYVPRMDDQKEYWLLKQKCIMAQNCLTNAVQFMSNMRYDSTEEAKAAMTKEKLAELAGFLLEKTWKACGGEAAEK